MRIELKATELLEQRPKPKSIQQTVLLPLQGRPGFAFGICAIDNTREESYGVCQIIQDYIERLANTFENDANPQHRFEQFLGAINEEFSFQVKEGAWQFPVQEMGAVVGIATEDIMYLSGTGDLTVLFLHRTPAQRYQVFNLSRSIQTGQALPTWEKPFAVLLDGELHPGDVFVMSSEDLQQKLPQDELNNILATLPPKSASAKIRQYLPPKLDLSLIILQARDVAAAEAGTEVADKLSERSIDEFEQLGTETQRVLEDQKLGVAGAVARTFKRKKKSDTSTEDRPKPRFQSLLSLGKASVRAGMRFGSMLARVGGRYARATGASASSLAKKQDRERVVEDMKAKIDTSLSEKRKRLSGLPKRSRYLLIAALGILLLFAISVKTISTARSRSAAEESYRGQVSAAEQKIDEASAAVIYKDEQRARDLLLQAEEMISTIPTDTEEQRAIVDKFHQDIEAQRDELRHVVRIPEPPLVASLSSFNTAPTALLAHDERLLAFGEDARVYDVGLQEKDAVALDLQGDLGAAIDATASDTSILFLDATGIISSLDLEKPSLTPTTLQADEGRTWAGLEAYGGRVYVLQPANADTETQIIRFTATNNGFNSGSTWIQTRSSDLKDATAMTIDGTIFVLTNSGKIVRFESGNEVSWNQAEVDPPLATPTDIWTQTESAFVYALDPGTGRVVVYRKSNGAFVLQYQSEAFVGASGFTVDESAKTIYLSVGSEIYRIGTSHL